MIRMLFITLLFFFGPALLMFALHRLIMLGRFWLKTRQLRQPQENEIIDITPSAHYKQKPGIVFIVFSICIATLSAWFVWQSMQEQPSVNKVYVPAHINANGEIIPGGMQQNRAREQDTLKFIDETKKVTDGASTNE